MPVVLLDLAVAAAVLLCRGGREDIPADAAAGLLAGAMGAGGEPPAMLLSGLGEPSVRAARVAGRNYHLC